MMDEKRAWVEVDLDALAHNAAQFRDAAPCECELMAIVKADAYGHGAVRVAKRLQSEGVKSFAVATAGEGIQLRESGLGGDILILNYTHPQYAEYLSAHNLTQLIIDGAYAKALDETGHKINVHLAIDTGMHREGIPAANTEEIESVFTRKNLNVLGVATHLASSDSLSAQDIEFSNLQIEKFFATVDEIKSRGHEPGKLHIQASYGLLNYPELRCDYSRIGIGLYGVMSHFEATKTQLDLKPVLALKATVAQVRRIDAGESVSYSRTFTADKPMKIATVCIGYADGVPRQLSGNNAECIVNGSRVPIVGRICMDLLMIDVSGIDSIEAGDVATLIGRDGDEEIRCEEVASKAGTITNEILCRLGGRLPRLYTSRSSTARD